MTRKRKGSPSQSSFKDIEASSSTKDPLSTAWSIPIEILGLITDILMADGRLTTVANLARTHSTVYQLVTPKLWYCVKLRGYSQVSMFLQEFVLLHQQNRRTGGFTGKGRHGILAQLPLPILRHLDIDMSHFVIEESYVHTLRAKRLSSIVQLWNFHQSAPRDIETLRIYGHVERTDESTSLLGHLSDIVRARHIQWRAVSSELFWQSEANLVNIRVAFWRDLSEARKDAWRRWVETMQHTGEGYLESFDLPFYSISPASAKARHTTLSNPMITKYFRQTGRGEGWTTIISRTMEKAIKEDPPHSKLPTFLFYNFTAELISILKSELEPIFKRPGMPEMNKVIHFIDDEKMVDGTGDEWREWLKRDVWGADESDADAEGERSG